MNQSCPLCEAPYIKTITLDAPKEPRLMHVFSCGNRAHRYSQGSTDLHEPTDLCRARQRLLDDIVVRCTEELWRRSLTSANLPFSSGSSLRDRVTECREVSLDFARLTVALRYPLPVEAKSEGPKP